MVQCTMSDGERNTDLVIRVHLIVSTFLSATCQTFRASSYGKAWYVDPDLWGVGISPEARKADLGQLDQYAKGKKIVQIVHTGILQAHAFLHPAYDTKKQQSRAGGDWW